jgi:hypothetical protein
MSYKNPEDLRVWFANNYERIKAQRKLYRLKNRKKILLQKKIYRAARRKILVEKQTVYYNSHKAERRLYIKTWTKNKRNNDPIFKLKDTLRKRLLNALKLQNVSKTTSIIKHIGCSIPELKTHLESKFTKGMCWENHGEWHIDHIIPLCRAKSEPEILKLNHFTNLQPLWATSKIAEKYGEVDYIGNLEKGAD